MTRSLRASFFAILMSVVGPVAAQEPIRIGLIVDRTAAPQ